MIKEFANILAINVEYFSVETLKRLDTIWLWITSITIRAAVYLLSCKILVNCRVGIEKFDLAVQNRMEVAFSSSPGHKPHDAADTALGLIITLQQHIFEHDIRVRSFVSA